VAGTFQNANGIFNAGDDRLFVTEQEGYVVVLTRKPDGTFRNAGTFLDIRDRVACCGEKGLLGLAFPPDYKRTGRFYVTYAGSGHTWNLDERRVSDSNPNRADPDFRRSLIRIYKPRDYHWGGNMAFGPDGYLWIGMGDGGFDGGPNDPGDPDNRAQDLGQIFGKMLRIDPRNPDGPGGAKYGIPPDNPFAKRRAEVWALGLRNPWRWSFDRLTNDLWITDVGMHDWEEVNRAKAPNKGKGANYGWRLMEGPDCYNPSSGCQSGRDLKMPIAEYRHADTSSGYLCAITGGFVYRGKASPALRSWYVFGDYCSGAIFMLDSGGPNHQRPRLGLDTDFTISSMGEDVNGEIYVADYHDGASLWRLVGRPR
jgi:glucose/arabinose dehydrogenase